MPIDPQRPIPLYFQLKTLLLQEMASGRYGPGDRLPTEHELCKRFAISRTPVTRALSELADEGVVLRHRGRGTFVNPQWAPRHQHGDEIRIIVHEEGPWETIIRRAAPIDLSVNVSAVPRADLHHVLTQAVAEGRAPDLAVLDSVWVAEFAASGFLHALDELDPDWTRTDHEGDFLLPLVEATRHKGRTYAVSAVADVAGIWYRREALEPHGSAPPATWEDLRTTAQAVALDGIPYPIVMPAGVRGDETTAYCLLAFLASNGASVLGNDRVSLDSRATVEVLQFLRRLVEEKLMPPEAVGFEWNEPSCLLAHGEAALSVGGSYEAATLAEMMNVGLPELWDQVGFTAVPAGPVEAPASLAGTMVYGVFRQARHPSQAMRLLKHVVAPEALVEVAQATGRIPPRRTAVALASPRSPFVAQTSQILEQAITRPSTPLYPRVSAQLQAMLEDVLSGRMEPAPAAQRAAEMIGAITGLPVMREPDIARSFPVA